MTAPIRVFLADDDKDFRRVYRRLFERTDGFQVLDEAGRACQMVCVRGRVSDLEEIDCERDQA